MEINYQNIENKIFIIPDKSIPIVYLSLLFLTGNYKEKPENLGINNLCLKTMIRSTKSLKYESFQYYLEKNSISISSSGGNFASTISLSFPFYSSYRAIEILKEVLFNYKLRQEDIDEVKRDTLNSIKLSKDDVWTYLYENSDKAFYNSFLSWDTRGTPNTIKEINRSSLIKWLENKIFDKKVKKIIVVSGYVNESFKNKLYKTFSDFLYPDHGYYQKMQDFDIIKTNKKERLNKKEVGISLIFEAPAMSIESIKFRIINAILSSMSGRLFTNIREKKELAYAITSVYDPIPFNKGNLKIFMLTSKEKKQESLNSLQQEIQKIINEGFNQEELNVAKNYLIGLFTSSLQKRSFKNALLAKIKAYNIPDNYIIDYIKIIEKTTLEEINQIKEIFENKPSLFIVD
ncbi:MAG: M16 family metallopeptidase [bacterium]